MLEEHWRPRRPKPKTLQPYNPNPKPFTIYELQALGVKLNAASSENGGTGVGETLEGQSYPKP